jgi:uncharacterized protein
MENPVGWFEIPVLDMDRAISFYEKVLNVKIQKVDMGGLMMGWFPFDEKVVGASGALVQQPENYKPSTDGVLIYFSASSGDLGHELGRVESAGGKVLQAKTLISSEVGYMGVFLDTEGNRAALHSRV